MEISTISYVLSMSIYVLFLLGFTVAMRRNYKLSALVWIGSLLTIPLWIAGVDGWFRWAKNLSVIIPLIIVSLTRISTYEQRTGKFWRFFQKGWNVWFLYGILFLNIMEATLKDVALGNYANALTGFLLCVTIPLPMKYWSYNRGEHSDYYAYTTIAWNFMYTTWNACFVFAETPVFFASSLCIIFAAELYPFLKRKPELYIFARSQTLGAHLLIRSCIPALFPAVMNASSWQNPTLLGYWGIMNIVLMVPYSVWYFYQLAKGNGEQAFMRHALPAK